jgi:hypothetical protein
MHYGTSISKAMKGSGDDYELDDDDDDDDDYEELSEPEEVPNNERVRVWLGNCQTKSLYFTAENQGNIGIVG